MKQTAVQKFWDKIALKLSFEQLNEFVSEFKKAKEMEKDQILDAYDRGEANEYSYEHIQDYKDVSPEQYYKETYEK